jgi:hypothetical protein
MKPVIAFLPSPGTEQEVHILAHFVEIFRQSMWFRVREVMEPDLRDPFPERVRRNKPEQELQLLQVLLGFVGHGAKVKRRILEIVVQEYNEQRFWKKMNASMFQEDQISRKAEKQRSATN